MENSLFFSWELDDFMWKFNFDLKGQTPEQAGNIAKCMTELILDRYMRAVGYGVCLAIEFS